MTQLQILNYLIDLYEENEKSKTVKCELIIDDDLFSGYHEEANLRFRTQLNQDVRKLELKHFVRVEWHHPFQMQRMKKISLNDTHVLEIYHVLRRKPKVKNTQLLQQILKEYAKERTRLGSIAQDLMTKSELKEPLFHALRVATIEEIEDAFLAIKALLRNHVLKSKEQFSIEVFGDEETFSHVEYIIKPILLNYHLISKTETHDYLASFYIRAEETYVHLKGCGDFEINGVCVNLKTWPNDFVVNCKTLETFKWGSSRLKRIVITSSYHDFIDYKTKDDLVLYCKNDLLTPAYIQTHFPMFIKQKLPLIRRGAS